MTAWGIMARPHGVNNSLYHNDAIHGSGGIIEPFQFKIDILTNSVVDFSVKLHGQECIYKVTSPTTKNNKCVLSGYLDQQEKGYNRFTRDRKGSFGAFSNLSSCSDVQDSATTHSRTIGVEENSQDPKTSRFEQYGKPTARS